ncbi:hypothetical protein CUMW_166960 [Citrus unshiu]|uniref:Amino acid transporter transmembrane domain-containing protein n=2 Tax=Citrus TaxID=2706 RepID=A0A067DD52_CITSI|nr:hypothetical protein CISIN_1g046310mg [Citrus sinensis]GAY55813.1 hypothetical protein CUMW_166960 [Citrus unshiu]
MYKGVSPAYSNWPSVDTGYLDQKSSLVSWLSLAIPEWTNCDSKPPCCDSNIRMLSGVHSIIYCGPTHAYLEETMLFNQSARHIPLRDRFIRLTFTSIYIVLVTLVAAAMPFFSEILCPSVVPSIAYLKAGRTPRDTNSDTQCSSLTA